MTVPLRSKVLKRLGGNILKVDDEDELNHLLQPREDDEYKMRHKVCPKRWKRPV